MFTETREYADYLTDLLCQTVWIRALAESGPAEIRETHIPALTEVAEKIDGLISTLRPIEKVDNGQAKVLRREDP